MGKYFKNNNGGGIIELIMVMMLLLVFGFTIFTLIITGSKTEERIIENKNAQSDVRIAMSYINVLLRKNDAERTIKIRPVEFTGENGIVITELTADGLYDTWIYFYDGKILECIVDKDEQPLYDNSLEIIEIENFTIDLDEEASMIISIYSYTYNHEKQTVVNYYTLRHYNSKPQPVEEVVETP